MKIRNPISTSLFRRLKAVALPLALFLLCAAMQTDALARHIKGGWIYYTYVGKTGNSHTYNLTIKVYRDCEPPTDGQNDELITVTAFSNADNTVATTVVLSLMSTSRLNKVAYSECVNPKPQVCYSVMEYSGTITLPESQQGYTLAFQRCCRIRDIVNITSPSDIYGNTYFISIPGTRLLATAPVNSSPKFTMNDTLLVCYNSSVNLDYSAIDPDGDSLDYYFVPAVVGGSQRDPNPRTSSSPPYESLPYHPRFSADNPFGTNLQIDHRTGLITGISPATTGEYVIGVAIDEYRQGRRIATTRKELHVNVANCTVAEAELPVRIMSCDGYTVQFENMSASPAIKSYYWDFGVRGDPNATSTLPRPSFQYPDTGIYIAKLVVNRETACPDSTTTEVRVYPEFKADFDFRGACYLNPFNFTDRSTATFGRVSNWRWNFGDATTQRDSSRLQNPAYTYPAPGTQPAVQLIATSSLGCTDTITKLVDVLDRPTIHLPFRDTLICSIDSLPLIATASGGTYSWSPATNIINPNSATPIVFPKQTMYYKVTVTENSCIATDSIKVNVLDFITVKGPADTTICLTDSISVFAETQGLGFRWEPPELFDDPNVQNPKLSPVDATTTFKITANLGKCQATDDFRIVTVPYPLVDAGNDTIICFGDPAELNGSSDGSSYTWTPAAFVSSPTLLRSEANPSEPTIFTLTVTDTKGCPKPAFDTVLVFVRPQIEIFAGRDTNLVYGQTLQLNAVHTGEGILWVPPIGLSDYTISNPTGLYSPEMLPFGVDTLRYFVTSFTPEGCSATDDVFIRLFNVEPTVFVPSAFTPNGDGLNDVIRPIAVGLSEFDFFRIFNRFGQVVFQSNNPEAGWDGRINGIAQGTGTYVYLVKAKDFQGKDLVLKGTITLIR